MNDHDPSPTDIVIPEMSGQGEVAVVSVRPAARDHLVAWDATQRLMAIHESGHVTAAAALGMTVRVVDITSRHGGSTEVAGPMDDTALPWETSARMLDKVVVSLAGAAAERAVLGEHTSGVEADYDRAVGEAMSWLRAGFGGRGIFVGEGGLGFGYLTEQVKSRTIARVQKIIEESQERADLLIAEHRDAVMSVASAVYDHRRLSDGDLAAVLAAAGLIRGGT